MTINYSLDITGVFPEDSLRTFQNAYNETSQMSYYKKYEKEIESLFLSELENNIRQNNIEVKDLKESFSVNVTNNRIEFITTKPNLANKIEYGTDGFMGARFMQPSVMEIGNFMSKKIISNATSYYDSKAPIRSKTEYGYSGVLPLNTNRYGFMLK